MKIIERFKLIFLKLTFKWNNLKNSEAERKRLFAERQQRRAERLEKNDKAGEPTGESANSDADESKVESKMESKDDELASVNELKDDEIELAE